MKNRSKFMRLFTNLGALPDKTAEITRCMRGRTHAEKEAIAAMYAQLVLGTKTLGTLDRVIQRLVYKMKYSKQADKK